MTNRSNANNFTWKKFFRNNGYYMVLILCVAAVGVSGYLFVHIATEITENQVESLYSVPVTPTTTTPSQPATTASATTDSATESMATEVIPTVEPDVPVVTMAPASGEVLTVFSMEELAYNETTKDWRTHGGIDLACDTGAYVLAARDGTVTSIYYDNDLGWTVALSHEGGLETAYSNLAETAVVNVGDVVQAGDAIGTVGDTAITEVGQAPHVHFAVYQDSVAVNPEEFLAANT